MQYRSVPIDAQRTLDMWAQRVRDNRAHSISEVFPGQNPIAAAYRAQCPRLVQLGYLVPPWDDGLRPEQRVFDPNQRYCLATVYGSPGTQSPGGFASQANPVSDPSDGDPYNRPPYATSSIYPSSNLSAVRPPSSPNPDQSARPSAASWPLPEPTEALPTQVGTPALGAPWQRFADAIAVAYDDEHDLYEILFRNCHLNQADEVTAAFAVLSGKVRALFNAHGRYVGVFLVNIFDLHVGGGDITHLWGEQLRRFQEQFCERFSLPGQQPRFLIARYSAASDVGRAPSAVAEIDDVMMRVQVFTEAAIQAFQSNIVSSRQEGVAGLIALRERYGTPPPTRFSPPSDWQ